MREYEKVDAPADFPGMCICGSQKAPQVDTHLVKNAYGHVYVCRQCGTRIGRALGLVKGSEHERLQDAADELIQASVEIATRQSIVEKQATMIVQLGQRLELQAEQIERLQGELKLARKQMGQIAEMAAA